MIVKKTGFTYFVCIIFGIISIGSLATSSFDVAQVLGQKDNLLFVGIALFLGIILIALITACSKIMEKISKNGGFSIPEANGFVEGVFLFMMVVGTFLSRVIYLASLGGNINTETIYLNAITDGSNLAQFSNGEQLYIKALNLAISLFGTKITASIYLQIICQMIIVICLYYCVRLLINRISAAIVTAFYAFVPYTVHQIQENNPQVFLTLLFAVGVFLVILLARLSHFMLIGSFKSLLTFLLAGVYLGFLCYADPLGLAMILLMIGMFAFAQNENADMTGQKAVIQSIFTIIGIILGFGGIIFLNSSLKDSNLIDELMNCFTVFTSKISFQYQIPLPCYGTYFSLLIICFMFPWFIRIFKIQRDFGSPLMILPTVAIIFSCLGFSKIDYSALLTYFGCIFMAFGLFSIGRNDLQRENIEEEKKEFEKVAKANMFAKKPNDSIVTKSVTLQNTGKVTSRTPQVKLTSNAKTNMREMEASLDFLKKGEAQVKSVSTAPQKPVVKEKMDIEKTEQTVAPMKKEESSGTVINDHQSAAILKTGNNNSAPKTAIITQTNSVTIAAPIPSNGKNHDVEEKEHKQEVEEKPQSIMAVPPKDTPKPPMVKYGRRLDYKTAKVSNGSENPLLGKGTPNGNPALKAATIEQQVTDAAKPIPTPPKEDSLRMDEDKVEETPVIPVKPIVVPAPETIPAMIPGRNAISAEQNRATTNNEIKDNHNQNAKEELVGQNKPSPTQMIHNPLPTPKKHVAKELEFDILPQSSNMHFDIVDLKEYDHFDIN